MWGKLIQEIIEEIIQIITNPKQHWLRVKKDKDSFSGVFNKFLLPSLLLVFIAIILGDVLFESEFGIILKNSLITATRKIATLLLVLFSSIMIIYETSRIFKIPVEFEFARKIGIYSLLPLVIITAIIGLFPFLGFVGLGAFYCLYLVYSALVNIYEIQGTKNIAYFSVLLLSLFFAYILITLLLSKLTALIIY